MDYPYSSVFYDPYPDDWVVEDYDWFVYRPHSAFANDAAIRDDIESQLFWSPFVDKDEITVTVNDGVATLRGTVDDWSERRAATENAFEGGAVSVRNELKVSVAD